MTPSRRDPAAPAAAVELGGGVSVVALTDAIADHRALIEDAFPGRPASGWPAVREAHAATVTPDGRWRLPIHTFLVRTPDATVLVDCGAGSADTIAAEVFDVVGTLPGQLTTMGVEPGAIDALVFTHLHEDHIGWASDPLTDEKTFPRARYLVCRPEWEANHPAGEGPPSWVRQTLDPLSSRGALELIEPGQVVDGVVLVPLPGHTPGHCGVIVSGPAGTVVLVGDAFNHPQQVSEPAIPSLADGDRARATQTRREIVERATAGDWTLLGSAHLPGAWWSVDAGDGPARWRSRADDLTVRPPEGRPGAARARPA